jgi:ribose 1,5-bisphosphokinase
MTAPIKTAVKQGRLVYVIGPSGAGKDSVIAYARDRLGNEDGYVFARRHITRLAESGGEDHIPIAPAEFERACSENRFALHWRGNGHFYGVDRGVDLLLAQGRHVVLNGSRAYLPVAAERYSCLLPVLIRIDPAVLRQRLMARGRETADEVESRIHRAAALGPIDHSALIVISNNGMLSEAGDAFVRLLRTL